FETTEFDKLNDKDMKRYNSSVFDDWDVQLALDYQRELGMKEGIQHGILRGRKEGVLRGRKEGMQQGMYTIIKRMTKTGLPVIQVAQMTGMSIDEVNAILNSEK
ncbi:MAG: hypothetical protein LBS25_04775, partial [Candidatus Symbiothrix sp.]|nr:hypothetical protein [Candidatus Symbiothrix sp.]